MKLDQLQKKLLAAARAHPPTARVPYAFEKRIVAHLAALPPLDPWAFWAPALWRGAAPCLALALLLGVWSFTSSNQTPVATDKEEFSQHFERTMLAAVNENDTEEIW
jgi:hypothetical protein